MRDYEKELELRCEFIRQTVSVAHASGVIFGNSGGKDSALVAILCKKAGVKLLGVQMPCQSKRNFGEDLTDAEELAKEFDFPVTTVDLTSVKENLLKSIADKNDYDITPQASSNIAPRLRMTTLYALGQSLNYLVAGTGNRSEIYMGYFTKWGDGGSDFNPISDLTVTEIYEFLKFLDAPSAFVTKAPSAGLYEGQTDEKDMGITYSELDEFLLSGKTPPALEKIERAHKITEHKRNMPKTYK